MTTLNSILDGSDRETCRHCEYYDDGTGAKRTAAIGDCLNPLSPRFQTTPGDSCSKWSRNSTDGKATDGNL